MAAEVNVLSDSRAVLIGVSDYDYPEFPPIRAARNSLQAMHDLLVDPTLCGWPPEQITVLENPASAADLADEIADLAESTTGVLLLYYVGHGVLSARGELCLTVTSTRPSRPKISGLAWENVAEIVRACPARTRLVILDCCFAGQAIEALSGDGDASLADIAHVEGVYTLTATTRNRTAHVPPPGQQKTACTSFTGELQALIRSGIPGKSAWLTFGDIYPVLRQRLRAKVLPVPNQRGTDTAYLFPFTANAAARTRADARNAPHQGDRLRREIHKSPKARTDRARAARILDDAESIAQSITREDWKALALAEVAGTLAATDSDRATRLSADAERAARSVISKSAQGLALAELAGALAATDPDRAQRIAQTINHERWKALGLGDVAGTLATADQDSAERIAQSIAQIHQKALALGRIAGTVAATDPDRAAQLSADAERIAQSITFNRLRALALAEVAGALAATDPDRSARLSGEAERIAQSMISESERALALAGVAGALAATDPDRAERIAQSITREDERAVALGRVAGALAATDPDRSARLSADTERIAQSMTSESAKGMALAMAAGALAATDPDRAERIAQSITHENERARALSRIAGTLAATDPDRAEGIAQSITHEDWKVQALVRIARAWSEG